MHPVAESSWKIAWSTFPKDGRMAAEGGWLRGQITFAWDAPVVDVRAWVGRHAVNGFIIDLSAEAAVEPNPSSLHFVVFVRPPLGCSRLRLEFFDAHHGEWREGFQQEIESDERAVKSEHDAVDEPSAGWMLLRTLRRQYTRPHHSWRDHAQAVGNGGAGTSPRIEPSAPLYGCLEEPGASVRTNHGLLAVNGWVAHATRGIVSLTAAIDPRLPARMAYGAPRRDVAAAFGELHDPLHTQFSGEVVVPPSQPVPWALVVVVELDDGQRVLAFARRVSGPAFALDIPGELPPYSARRFVTAAAAVFAVRGWRGLPRAVRECAVAQQTYRRHASPGVPRREIIYHAPNELSAVARRYSVVIVNDNFTLGGAALFALEYAEFLKTKLGWTVRLVTPLDGPLRARCDTAGIPVDLVDASLVCTGANGSTFPAQIEQLAGTVGWEEIDAVIVNTLVAHWAVALARACGKPSFFYVHESARLDALFTPDLVPFAQAAISGATRTVFLTEWTRLLHRDLEQQENFRLMRSWVDLAQIDRYAAAHGRDSLRQRAGIPLNAIVVVCLGSICDRKGQRLLVRAVDYFMRTQRNSDRMRSTLRFLLVGARPSPDVTQLKQDIAWRGLDDWIQLVDETPDALRYLRLADIYVCPSFEEGLPRAIMEAAAFGLKIVTTNVCGIPELWRESEAWLVPPGEPTLLADALGAAMEAHRAGDLTRPRSARARMEQFFNADQVLPQHAALICATLATT